MLKTYKAGDSTQLSVHFNVKEFACKCGKQHETPIDDNLITMLEKLYTSLDCSKIIVSSGYRCAEHDKSVGGNGSGYHTKGMAADICCYGKNGAIISSKLVCCTAQDLGFGGIANINADYTYTHVDVRTGSRWLGNEIVNYNTVTDDFYKYFGIKKDVNPLMTGIDISYCQTKIDWNKLQTDFVIIKAGQRDFTDPLYEQHYKAATEKGIPCGAYWYGEAKSITDAQKEADCCIERLKGKRFAFPIYYDVEGYMLNLSDDLLSSIIVAFMEKVEKAGYWVGLYMSGCPMKDKVRSNILSRYALWIADTRGIDPHEYIGADFGLWQYEVGQIDGITGDVDLNRCYTDYPARIKSKGLNGYGKEPEKPEIPDEKEEIPFEMEFNGVKYAGMLKKV